ncbi:MAG: diadenylate cyclase CdaA [Schleiferiaceae bacterium]
MNTLIDIGFFDILDIVLASWLIYQLYKLVKGTAAINIFIGVTAIYLIWKLVGALNMELLSEVLGQFIGVGFIALIVVFQQEIRKFLLVLGSTNLGGKKGFWKNLISLKKTEISTNVTEVAEACKNLSASYTGALIVITRKMPLGFYVDTGDKLDAVLSHRLIESIFHKESPLHDGAVIVNGNQILSARSILPVSESTTLPARFGLRHRSAVGLAEKTDALCIIVSEETGEISIVNDGEVKPLKPEELTGELKKEISEA